TAISEPLHERLCRIVENLGDFLRTGSKNGVEFAGAFLQCNCSRVGYLCDACFDGAEFDRYTRTDVAQTGSDCIGTFCKTGFGASEIAGNAGREGFAVTCERLARLGRRICDTSFNRTEFAGEAALDCFKPAGDGIGAFAETALCSSQIVGDAARKGLAVTGKRFTGSAGRIGDAGFDRAQLASEAAFDLAEATGNRIGAVAEAGFRARQVIDQACAECLTETVQSFTGLGCFS